MGPLEPTKLILRDLVAFPTVSVDSNLDLIANAASHFEDAVAVVDVSASPCGCKANLFATFGPMRDGGILLSGHSDVVPVPDQGWTSDPSIMAEREGKLFGRGPCDMEVYRRRAGDGTGVCSTGARPAFECHADL